MLKSVSDGSLLNAKLVLFIRFVDNTDDEDPFHERQHVRTKFGAPISKYSLSF